MADLINLLDVAPAPPIPIERQVDDIKPRLDDVGDVQWLDPEDLRRKKIEEPK